MPKYVPIELPHDVKASDCTIAAIRKRAGHPELEIDVTTNDGPGFRISSFDCLVFRFLDGVPIADEETTVLTGIRPDHPFYEVSETAFLQESLLPQYLAFTAAKHYRLMTPNEAADFIAITPPRVAPLEVKPAKKSD